MIVVLLTIDNAERHGNRCMMIHNISTHSSKKTKREKQQQLVAMVWKWLHWLLFPGVFGLHVAWAAYSAVKSVLAVSMMGTVSKLTCRWEALRGKEMFSSCVSMHFPLKLLVDVSLMLTRRARFRWILMQKRVKKRQP